MHTASPTLLGLALLAFTPAAALAGPPSYTLTNLGALMGATSSVGNGVNNSGQVTGSTSVGSGAFLTGPGGGGPFIDLGVLPDGTSSTGMAVNDKGQVAGYTVGPPGFETKSFLSGLNGGPLQALGSLGGQSTLAAAVNNSGEVTGTADDGTGNNTAFATGPNGQGIYNLGSISYDPESFGTGINNKGQITGGSGQAFLTGPNGAAITDADALPGTNGGFGSGVNDTGQVVGQFSANGGAATHAFLSGPNGGAVQDLGTLGGTNSFGEAVNNSGQAVGYSGITGSSATHAFLFTNGVLTDLNTLIAPGSGLTLTEALGISNTGFITGYGITSSGQEDAFLLTPSRLNPVPEASTTASFGLMLALGLSGFFVARRCKSVKA